MATGPGRRARSAREERARLLLACPADPGRRVEEAAALCEAAIDLVTRNPGRIEDPRLGEYNALIGVMGHPNRIKTVTLPWATLAGALAGRLDTSTDIDIRGALPPPRHASHRKPP